MPRAKASQTSSQPTIDYSQLIVSINNIISVLKRIASHSSYGRSSGNRLRHLNVMCVRIDMYGSGPILSVSSGHNVRKFSGLYHC